jgi:xanthine dehydrogenase iron-sulfur cluster and FAD-binding subunit A
MAREEEFQLCPNCKVGRLRLTGLAATSSDPQTNRVTNDLRGYKCDSCGYSEGGQAKVVAVNEQEAIRESTNTTTITSSPAATTAAAQAAEAEETAAEEEGKERLIKLRDTGDDNEMVAVREEEKEDTEEDL